MSAQRTRLAGLIALGFESISLSDGTAIGLNSTNAFATTIEFSVETNNARFRDDGTDPALTTGILYQKDNVYRRDGIANASNIAFQRSTGTSLIQLIGYRYPGDPAS